MVRSGGLPYKLIFTRVLSASKRQSIILAFERRRVGGVVASRMGCWDGVSDGAGKTRPTRHRVCCAAGRSVVHSRARRASSRPDSSKHCAQRTQHSARECYVSKLSI